MSNPPIKKQNLGNSESKDMPPYFLSKYIKTSNLTNPHLDKGKKCYPDFKYGISYEAPTYFSS